MRSLRQLAARSRVVLVALLVVSGVLAVPSTASAELVGSVSGTVLGAGQPIPNAWVTVMPVTPTGDWAGQPATTTTDADGRYEFGELYAFHVKIKVRAPALSDLASAYWPQAYSFAEAGTLRVANSGSTADVDLPGAGTISGQVVDAQSGQPISGARVLAHVDSPPGWEAVGSQSLTSVGPGGFLIEGLPPVPVGLQVLSPAGSNYLDQWYDGVGFHGEAKKLEPGATGVEVMLRQGGQISGTVRDTAGASVPGVTVTIIGCPGLCPLTKVTDESGGYRINAVPPGQGLRAYADGSQVGLLNGWYSAPGADSDTMVGLAPGEVLDGLDFRLTPGAVLVGLIVDTQTGEPVLGASGDLRDLSNPLSAFGSTPVRPPDQSSTAGLSAGGAVPSPDGSGTAPAPQRSALPPASEFRIGPVPPGQYTLVVFPGRENAEYRPVTWVDSTGFDGPATVELAPGEQARITVSLAAQRPPESEPGGSGAADCADGPAAPAPSAGWPGLSRGFLSGVGGGFLAGAAPA